MASLIRTKVPLRSAACEHVGTSHNGSGKHISQRLPSSARAPPDACRVQSELAAVGVLDEQFQRTRSGGAAAATAAAAGPSAGGDVPSAAALHSVVEEVMRTAQARLAALPDVADPTTKPKLEVHRPLTVPLPLCPSPVPAVPIRALTPVIWTYLRARD